VQSFRNKLIYVPVLCGLAMKGLIAHPFVLPTNEEKNANRQEAGDVMYSCCIAESVDPNGYIFYGTPRPLSNGWSNRAVAGTPSP
jgi:hypothetical protein